MLVYDNNVIRIDNFEDVTLRSVCGTKIYFALLQMEFLCVQCMIEIYFHEVIISKLFSFFTAGRIFSRYLGRKSYLEKR